MTEATLTQKRLKELLDYDPETGVFTRRVSINYSNAKAGDVAGNVYPSGYRLIWVDRSRYLAHRLAWFYEYGKWPKDQIDHINGIRDDNRIENLREATPLQQSQNRQKANSTSKTGILGVSRFKRDQKWRASIRVNGKDINLGFFDRIEDAVAARLAAKRRYHEFGSF